MSTRYEVTRELCIEFASGYAGISVETLEEVLGDSAEALAGQSLLALEGPAVADSEAFDVGQQVLLEATLIGVIANVVTEVLKIGAARLFRQLSTPAKRHRFLELVAGTSTDEMAFAQEVLRWVDARRDRLAALLGVDRQGDRNGR